jgi:taurine dioxygenase
VKVHPVAGRIGAEITGVDLTGPLGGEDIARIRSALLLWKVVFFRRQYLDHAGHVAFARRLGEPLDADGGSVSPPGHPEVETIGNWRAEGERFGMDGPEWSDRQVHAVFRGWHADLTYTLAPPAAGILRAETVPPFGGDTTWANLAAAYDGLSEPVRRFAEGLRAEHRFGAGYLPRPRHDAFAAHLQQHQGAALHPVVRVHPETGERALFVNPRYTERIAGVSRAESGHLLKLFTEQALRPEYTVRFRWEPGCVALWDNRAAMHLAPADTAHLDHPRIMHRVGIAGDVPVGVDGIRSESLTSPEGAQCAG